VLHVRCEHVSGADAAALSAKIAGRFKASYGIDAKVELVERGKLPRFAYKAARVVDEG
jgi:phenylacetate-coenzyme A ligase PaaK-like adenylate-forming protein